MTREEKLFRKLNNGDSSALDELIRGIYPDIFRYCQYHTSSRQTAEDATQETFLKAVRHIDNCTDYKQFRAYLYKIAVNTCIDFWRKTEHPEYQLPEEYIEAGFEQVESEINLKKMLDALPVNQREVVILRYVHELKTREIASIVNEPLRTVQSRLRAALKVLKKNLAKGESTNGQKF